MKQVGHSLGGQVQARLKMTDLYRSLVCTANTDRRIWVAGSVTGGVAATVPNLALIFVAYSCGDQGDSSLNDQEALQVELDT